MIEYVNLTSAVGCHCGMLVDEDRRQEQESNDSNTQEFSLEKAYIAMHLSGHPLVFLGRICFG